MKTVIAAIDGSAPALKGVHYAARIAKALQAKLELVYVSFPNLLPPHTYAKAIADIDAAETAHAKEVFDAAEASVADVGLECRRTRKTGGPAEEIADLAAAGPEVWGVVIGATGRNAVSRVLLGSTVDRLVHICSKPVVVVR